MAKSIHQSRKLYILIFGALAIIGCNDGNSGINNVNAGKDYYNQTCLSCHLRGDNTLYQPSLDKMSKYKIATLSKLLLKLKSDSVHMQLLPTSYNTDSLISFIKSYKRQNIIP